MIRLPALAETGPSNALPLIGLAALLLTAGVILRSRATNPGGRGGRG